MCFFPKRFLLLDETKRFLLLDEKMVVAVPWMFSSDLYYQQIKKLSVVGNARGKPADFIQVITSPPH